jgi:hypothetical protein
MPGRNGRGPTGAGQLTGRGMGRCGGAETQKGTRRGRHGWRHGCQATGLPGWKRAENTQAEVPTSTGETEQQRLQRQAELLRAQLVRIEGLLEPAMAPEPTHAG